MQRNLVIMIMLVLALTFPLLTACPKNGKSFQDMAPKEKGVWMMSIYNGQYADYQAQATRIDLNEAQKKILREKKEIMTEVYPLILTYVGYAESGIIPSVSLETMIVTNLERLLSMI